MADIDKQTRASKLGKKYGGGTGTATGRHREQFILAWLARWRYSHYEVMALALGCEPKPIRDKLTKMQHRKLVVKQPTIFSKQGYVYTLTAHGERAFRDISVRKIPTRLDASKIKTNSSIPHDLGVQVIIAEQWYRGNVKEFFTQFELNDSKLNIRYSPDAFYINKDNKRIAVEFEATPKSEYRLLGKYFDMRKSNVEDGYFDKQFENMSAWCDDNSKGYEYVEYTLLTAKQTSVYRKHVNTYIRRRITDPDNRSGWLGSWLFTEESLSRKIESIIYDKQLPDSGLVNLL